MENTIRFYYGFEPRTITFPAGCEYRPTDTLLYYLRHALGAKATREGCGVGDCGACTVVLAELREGRLVYYPVNACLVMLPMLDGKWLILSEHLRDGEWLHPVQEALLKHYGVQCGFCTSGMLMSMFSLYKNTIHPDRQTVEERLTGNLCRCTGYRSILDAAIEACTGEADRFSEFEPQVLEWMKSCQLREFCCEDENKIYDRPVRLVDALMYYRRDPQVSLVCGGSNLMVAHHAQGQPPHRVLDLSAIGELYGVEVNEQGVRLGASVPVERVREAVKTLFPEIYDLLGRFASCQIRQVASIAANLASTSSIADAIPALLAHHAVVRIAGMDGDAITLRDLPAREFIIGPRRNALQAGELIHSIFIPAIPAGVEIRCFKVSKRRSVDITMVGLGARIEWEQGVCRNVELYYAGMAATVRRATYAEQTLRGRALDPETILAAQQALERDFTPISDVHATASHRWELARNLLVMLTPEVKEELTSPR